MVDTIVPAAPAESTATERATEAPMAEELKSEAAKPSDTDDDPKQKQKKEKKKKKGKKTKKSKKKKA